MRSFVVALTVALLLAASSASGQGRRSPAKRVKVTNLPDVQAVEVVNAPAVQSVEVTNQPEVQAVEIVNPLAPTPAPPMRFQLVGFTAATYTGDMGGQFGVTQKCQLEFADSRMCSPEEVAATTSIPAGLSGAARVHSPAAYHSESTGPLFDAYLLPNSKNCRNWRESDSRLLTRLVESDGALSGPSGNSDSDVPCDAALPIACCALAP